MQTNTNMLAIPIQNLPRDIHRTYLAVFASGSNVTVTISSGAPFTIPDGQWWGPQPAPTNDITFAGSGTIILG